MHDINLFVLVIGGLTLGAVLCAVVRDARERELSWPMRGALLIVGFVLIYGVTKVPYLGG